MAYRSRLDGGMMGRPRSDTSDPNLSLSVPQAVPRLSRSPHPYRRKSLKLTDHDNVPSETENPPSRFRTPKSSSDSGTEADDEGTGFLRRLPAPPPRPHKGLRTATGFIGSDDIALWMERRPPWLPFVRASSRAASRRSSSEESSVSIVRTQERRNQRRRIEILRRLCETALLGSVGAFVLLRREVRQLAISWDIELFSYCCLVLGLYALYPLRIFPWSSALSRYRKSTLLSSFSVPTTFEPAPLLYPVLIPVLVSLSLPVTQPALVLPNIILSLSCLPPQVIPFGPFVHGYNLVHWMITVLPVLLSEHSPLTLNAYRPLSQLGLDPEILLLLFPLHQALIPTLHFLSTTSLLPAELQLLTTGLINLVLFSASPQTKILNALLWLGGITLFISCRYVLKWEVILARVPSWKFRRSPARPSSPKSLLNIIDHKVCERVGKIGEKVDTASSDSDSWSGSPVRGRRNPSLDYTSTLPRTFSFGRDRVPSALERIKPDDLWSSFWESSALLISRPRRHTFSTVSATEYTHKVRRQTTQSGRRRKLIAPDVASFLELTAAQARVRRWLYAGYTYVVVAAIILGPIRLYVAQVALSGDDPFGWALGYLFGNLNFFRFWVIMLNFDHWIRLPVRRGLEETSCHLGWVEHLRHDTFGEANTRLLISAYDLVVLAVGLAIVIRLSKIVEVDTRRKVFHGMMVFMLVPTIFVDPAFASLALALVLSIFLLLDLFRASQLPPISKPLTYFLAPYTDGRDHRGPVIVSHIFLLIGCAIPLWLSLADVPRSGDGPWSGWEVVSRDVSMVSGVICVGMGDAAASLVGRRFGRLKWFWGGGKSLEGSVAFALAVTVGLVTARAWLEFGGWKEGPFSLSSRSSYVASPNDSDTMVTTGDWWHSWPLILVKSVLAAGGASATEAVLTGANDNVIVPVVLWLLVRGLDI